MKRNRSNARSLVREKRRDLMKKKNVVGVGVGVDKSCDCNSILNVFVTKKESLNRLKTQDIIPSSINGFDVKVVEVGEIKALIMSPAERQKEWRPAPGGVSIGHYKITAGTLGCVLTSETGERVILSNNHILANSNDAKIGDAILQQGSFDGGTTTRSTIGTLKDFQKIVFDGEVVPPPPDGNDPPPSKDCSIANASKFFLKVLVSPINLAARLVNSSYRIEFGLSRQLKTIEEVDINSIYNKFDAAIAVPNSNSEVSDFILDLPTINGINENIFINMNVSKSGRTTALTTGKILSLDSTVKVDFGGGRMAIFEDQIIASHMSEPGDSGSLVVHDDKAIGLLFAGSDNVTVFNPIKDILTRFKCHF